MPKKFYWRIWHFRIFQKNGITEFFHILLIVSFSSKWNNAPKKLGVTMLFFQLYILEWISYRYVVSNELSVTKTNIIWK
jgi:hypothetical protein